MNTTAAVELFCESKWYGGTDEHEYLNALSSLFLSAAALIGLSAVDVLLCPPVISLSYGLMFIMGIGSFMHHWNSKQDPFWQKQDFYPMMWLTVLCCSILMTDIMRFVSNPFHRKVGLVVSSIFYCGYVMAGISTTDDTKQTALFGSAWAMCYIHLGVAYFCSTRNTVVALPRQFSFKRRISTDTYNKAVRADDFSIQWTPIMKKKFARLAQLAFLPAIAGAVVWLLTENNCTTSNAGKIGWVHSCIWHTTVAYSSWHLMQCVITLTADWNHTKVADILTIGPFMFCKIVEPSPESMIEYWRSRVAIDNTSTKRVSPETEGTESAAKEIV